MHREIYVTRPAMPPFEEYCAEIRDLWDTRRLTNMGEKHRELEVKLKAYLHAPHLTLFANGHLALESAIGVLGLSGEIITTPLRLLPPHTRSCAAKRRQRGKFRRRGGVQLPRDEGVHDGGRRHRHVCGSGPQAAAERCEE